MAGHHPPPAPAPEASRGLPGPGAAPQYRYAPRRRAPRREVGGAFAALLGGLAALVVLLVLGFAYFAGVEDGALPSLRPGERVDRGTATANKLYTTGQLAPVGCRVPEIQPGSAAMRRFMNALGDCLDESWTAQFGRASMPFTPPERVLWDAPGRGPCGSYPNPGASAFYCPANNTMYVGLDHIVETSGGEPLSNFAVFARVIAHEYGHHVQDRAGILLYGHRELTGAAAARTRDQVSRRIELQAQCLAGVFLGAEKGTLKITREQYAAMLADIRGRGDDRQPSGRRDHGSSRNYAGWVVEGYEKRRLSTCNTWTAPDGKVS